MKIQEVQRENRRLKRRLASTSRDLFNTKEKIGELSHTMKKQVESVPFLNGVISELRNEKSALKGQVRRLNQELQQQTVSHNIVLNPMSVGKQKGKS